MLGKKQDFIAVYGSLRSGTTLLRLMLDGHSGLRCTGESDFLFDHLRPDGAGQLHPDHTALELDRTYRAYLRAIATPPPSPPNVESMIAHMAGPGETPILMLHRNLPRLLALFPGCRIIHLLRDPRDVARSSIGMGWAGNVYHGVGHWIRTETDWANAGRALAPDQVLTVQYENLILNPEKELARICEFIGVSYEPAMLEYDTRSTYSKPDASLVFQWKKKLSDKEVGVVEGRIGPLLTASGYEPSGVTPCHPGPFGRAALKLENRVAVWRTRIRRYGLTDPLLVAFARRLNMPALSYGARRRMDKKVRAYLK